jgi:hypothetical protein
MLPKHLIGSSNEPTSLPLHTYRGEVLYIGRACRTRCGWWMTIDILDAGCDALLEFVFEATRMWRRTEQISSPEFERGLNDLSKETPQIKQGRQANFCRGC